MQRGFTFDFREDNEDNSKSSSMSVSQLTRRIKSNLEGEFHAISVEGEIGSISRAASGHIYLTLKDASAALDVVIWRSTATRLKQDFAEGEKVLIRGEITVYEPRGRYQLVASSVKSAGEGELQAKFEQMVQRLREEGLFEREHKKDLPQNPRCIGIITSATGAAVQDIIKIAKKRAPGVRLVVSPCLVQGKGASESIIKALDNLARWGECEAIIIGRGGGSLEDLMAFNDELVARAVFNCRVPILSAVGHEVDISICDLVADSRAATPSEAAEMLTGDISNQQRQLAGLYKALNRAISLSFKQAEYHLQELRNSAIFKRPEGLLSQQRQRLDEAADSFFQTGSRLLINSKHRFELLATKLEELSPLKVLARGYSVTRTPEKKLIRQASEVKAGAIIHTNLEKGILVSRVLETGEE